MTGWNGRPARVTLLAIIWYALAFAVAAAGAFFADWQPYVTNAWHVYFIENARGVLNSDSEITRSEDMLSPRDSDDRFTTLRRVLFESVQH